MKNYLIPTLLFIQILFVSKVDAQNISLNDNGATPDTSALLDLSSSTKGLLIPRLTLTQQNSIYHPATGLLIFNSTTKMFMTNIGTPTSPIWVSVGDLSAVSGPTTNSFRFVTGTSGTDFNINDNGDTVYTFNIPSASVLARGLITTDTQTLAGIKTFTDTLKVGSGIVLKSLLGGGSADSVLTINSSGIVAKRKVTDLLSVQSFSTGTSGTDFNISNSGTAHTFNIPSADVNIRGLITGSTQTIGGKKTFADTLKAASAVVLSTLSSGSGTDSLLTVDATTGVIKKRTASDFANNTPTNNVTFIQDNFEDFVFDAYAGAGSNDNQFSFTRAAVGAGASSDVDGSSATSANDYAGMDTMSTGTTNTGRSGLGSFNFIDRIKLGGKQVIYEVRVKVPTLSDATNSFITYFGLMDLVMNSTTIPTGDPTNGVYFKYSNSFNSGMWGSICRSAGSTIVPFNTGITVAANTWYKLKAVVNSTGTQVDFYVDGVFLGSTTTNIPTAAMKFVFKIEKTGSTSSRSCYVDYLGWRMVR